MLPICDGLQLHIPCMQHKDNVALLSTKSCEITLSNFGGMRMTTLGFFNQ